MNDIERRLDDKNFFYRLNTLINHLQAIAPAHAITLANLGADLYEVLSSPSDKASEERV